MTPKLSLLGRFLDWYTGGQITGAEAAIERATKWELLAQKLESEVYDLIDQRSELHEVNNVLHHKMTSGRTKDLAELKRLYDENCRLIGLFRAIIALETPSMAHVGKRAVKIAREALGK